MCMIEAIDIMPDGGKDLFLSINHQELEERARQLYVDRPELRPEPWSPTKSKNEFIKAYRRLPNV